jgi:hypothetical protein
LWYLSLLAPFVGTLWVPFFNSAEPRLGGIPFFYWYQFAWVAISAVLTAAVYFATRHGDDDGPAGPAGPDGAGRAAPLVPAAPDVTEPPEVRF